MSEIFVSVLLSLVFHNYSETLPVLSNLHDHADFVAITEFGIFFLMLSSGIELSFKSLKQASENSIWVAIGGMIFPLAPGMGLGWII